MYTEISIKKFINLDIFEKDYKYKTRILSFRTFKTKNVDFIDIYLQNHDDTFIIMSGHNRKTGESIIEIQSLENIWDLKLHNVCFDSDTKECIDVPYYIPRHTTCITDVMKTSDVLTTEYFCLSNISDRPEILFNLDKRKYKKCTSYDFLDKYFYGVKDYELRRKKIKDDDEFTILSRA